MVYRIHFTVHDLARTRVAEAPMPLSELDLAVRAFQDRGRPVRLGPWRRQILLRSSAPTRMAMSLIPPIGWSPGFLCPVRAGSPEELLEQVRATPLHRTARLPAAGTSDHHGPGLRRHSE